MNSNKKCSGFETYKWLIMLVLQAVVKIIMTFINQNEEPKKKRVSPRVLEEKK